MPKQMKDAEACAKPSSPSRSGHPVPNHLLPEALGILSEAMRQGDVGAAKVIVQTQTPKLKPIVPPIAPGLIDPDASPSDMARQASRLMAEGRISPDQAKEVTDVALTRAKIMDIAEGQAKLESLLEKVQDLERKAHLR